MSSPFLLPNYPGLLVTDLSETEDTLLFTIDSTYPTAICPLCRQISSKVHSHYSRKVLDLPSATHKVKLQLNVRRFFCHNPGCKRVTFAERLGQAIAAYAHRTNRLLEVLQKMALELSGEGAARLSKTLKMPASGDSFLKLVRKTPVTAFEEPKVVGIDDFALKKGQRYGTIVVDLERHQPIELLPDRTTETVASWFKLHPNIEVVSRDRASAYAEAARSGAPQAIQIADRWHLIKNISDHVKIFFDRNQLWRLKPPPAQPQLDLVSPNQPETSLSPQPKSVKVLGQIRKPTKQVELSNLKRERRLNRYEKVITLYEQGYSRRQLAEKTGLSRNTVRHYLQAGQFPEFSRSRQQRSKLKPYHPYLLQRFEQGISNASLLWIEIKAKGFTGSVDLVRRFLALLRTPNSLPDQVGFAPNPTTQVGKLTKLSPRQVAWWFTRPQADLKVEEQATLKWLLSQDEQYLAMYGLAQGFVEMVSNQQATVLESWLRTAESSKIKEMVGFARSLKSDYDAVLASLRLSYSNGQVEGQVSLLKYLKRQRFGRAKFDLLRILVLAY